MISEYALFCFVEKAKAIQSLEIKTISSQEDLPNMWEYVIRNSEFIFDQLHMVRFDGFLGTKKELSFLAFILAASPVLKKMTIAPVKGQLQVKPTGSYGKLLKLKKFSGQVVITFV
ncbi:uncharacterized protein LOC120255460 [Dioscorea cayenensis subsp. rotundata]|uniref:Uncharacterized protein LOC120255460 n=1 Tax=Dioscorea cayennensis subsp. rotundata TaxID=55577 RepID=A0AB40AW44_DIOCR|nr:uncharacterized protein LOC120255460 [Dioscorea cayenensis subsp. rotundata]